MLCGCFVFFFFSSRRRHTRFKCDWSSDVCSSDLRSLVPAGSVGIANNQTGMYPVASPGGRSEERRVGKKCRSRWAPYHLKKKQQRMAEGKEPREKGRAVYGRSGVCECS